jgi:hypothetical protein
VNEKRRGEALADDGQQRLENHPLAIVAHCAPSRASSVEKHAFVK